MEILIAIYLYINVFLAGGYFNERVGTVTTKMTLRDIISVLFIVLFGCFLLIYSVINSKIKRK